MEVAGGATRATTFPGDSKIGHEKSIPFSSQSPPSCSGVLFCFAATCCADVAPLRLHFVTHSHLIGSYVTELVSAAASLLAVVLCDLAKVKRVEG